MNKDASRGMALTGVIRMVVPELLLIAMPSVSFAARLSQISSHTTNPW